MSTYYPDAISEASRDLLRRINNGDFNLSRFAGGGLVMPPCRIRLRRTALRGWPGVASRWVWVAICPRCQQGGGSPTWTEAMAWADRHVRGQG